MAKNHFRARTAEQKEIYDHFRYLSDRYGRWQVWTDFVTMAACSLNLVDREQCSDEYLQVAKRYQQSELERFVRMFAVTTDAMERNLEQDFLGELFMALELGNEWKGQFFTPYCICSMMARISAGDLQEQLKHKHWTHVQDPACGAGATLLAFANECKRQRLNYQTSVLFVAQDIDRIAALMCFIQLSLVGCPGYVVIGDSLANPVVGGLLTPQKQPGQEIWYTPMFLSNVWQLRRRFAIIDSVVSNANSHYIPTTEESENKQMSLFTEE